MNVPKKESKIPRSIVDMNGGQKESGQWAKVPPEGLPFHIVDWLAAGLAGMTGKRSRLRQ